MAEAQTRFGLVETYTDYGRKRWFDEMHSDQLDLHYQIRDANPR